MKKVMFVAALVAASFLLGMSRGPGGGGCSTSQVSLAVPVEETPELPYFAPPEAIPVTEEEIFGCLRGSVVTYQRLRRITESRNEDLSILRETHRSWLAAGMIPEGVDETRFEWWDEQLEAIVVPNSIEEKVTNDYLGVRSKVLDELSFVTSRIQTLEIERIESRIRLSLAQGELDLAVRLSNGDPAFDSSVVSDAQAKRDELRVQRDDFERELEAQYKRIFEMVDLPYPSDS